MNFDISSEQNILQDSVDRFVQDHYELDKRQLLVLTEQGFSNDNWQTMAELGWLGVSVPEAHGGFGGNEIDTMILMQAFGKGLVLEPFFASTVLGAKAIADGGSEDLKTKMLPGVVDGSRQLTFAYAEAQSRFDLNDIVTRAQRDGDDYVINGHKSMVLHAASAHQIVVSTRTSGGQAEQAGISLFLIDADAAGVEITSFPTVDGQQAAEIKLEGVKVPSSRLLGALDQGYELLNSVATAGILALAAEAVGAMEILYKDTVAYTQEREQFDHALSDFQVLQHRMVDMFMEYEQCKSLLYRATLEVVQNSTGAQRSVHALKYYVGKMGTFIGENAVQLHGGMGTTEELRVGHYFKRLLVIDAQFGNSDHHLALFAA
ncbi:MAG: alkylation response protein AidB-like acyl-CoA dehydrogenase [Candidatus Azotimanducaceae bacterium]